MASVRSQDTAIALDDPAADHPWEGVRAIAESGIQIVYGGPTPSRDPEPYPQHRHTGEPLERGIGIKFKRGVSFNSDRTRDGHDTWQGFMGVTLHKLTWQFLVQDPVVPNERIVLRLPMMGMPPREPTAEMMAQARAGRPFDQDSWFAHARVIPATYFAHPSNQSDGTTGTIPIDNRCEFKTALPLDDADHDPRVRKTLGNLWFIALLPNELPSYHFWANPMDTPRRDDSLINGGVLGTVTDEDGRDLVHKKQNLRSSKRPRSASRSPPAALKQQKPKPTAQSSPTPDQQGRARSQPRSVVVKGGRVAKSELEKSSTRRAQKTAKRGGKK